jgi:hypothetical protein
VGGHRLSRRRCCGRCSRAPYMARRPSAPKSGAGSAVKPSAAELKTFRGTGLGPGGRSSPAWVNTASWPRTSRSARTPVPPARPCAATAPALLMCALARCTQAVRGLRDDGTAVGMAHQDDGPVDRPDERAEVGGVKSQSAQRLCRCQTGDSDSVQLDDDTGVYESANAPCTRTTVGDGGLLSVIGSFRRASTSSGRGADRRRWQPDGGWTLRRPWDGC